MLRGARETIATKRRVAAGCIRDEPGHILRQPCICISIAAQYRPTFWQQRLKLQLYSLGGSGGTVHRQRCQHEYRKQPKLIDSDCLSHGAPTYILQHPSPYFSWVIIVGRWIYTHLCCVPL